jgi:hypothetical protein
MHATQPSQRFTLRRARAGGGGPDPTPEAVMVVGGGGELTPLLSLTPNTV